MVRGVEGSTPRLDLETLRQVLDRVDEAVIYTDADFRILEWSPAAERMYGYTTEQAVGQVFTGLVHTRYEDTDYDTVLAEFRAEGHWHGEALQRGRGERELRVLASVTLLRDADGVPRGVVAINRDISESSRKDAALRESELRFRQFSENSRDVFWMSDLREPAVLFVSAAYEEVWGRTRESLYEDPSLFLSSIHPEDGKRVEATLQQQFAGLATSQEYRIVRPDGSVRWVYDRGFPIRDSTGAIAHVAGIARDITDLRVEEHKRKQLEARVQQSQRLQSLSVLAGGIAHDFNNLLMGVLGNIDLALMKLTDSGVRDNLQRAAQSAHAAAELTKQLVMYAGSSAGGSHVDWNSVISEMGVLLRKTCGDGVELQWRLASELAPVSLDAQQARLILLNLVTNAVEATAPGAGTVTLETRMQWVEPEEIARNRAELPAAAHCFVCLTVSDAGCGIGQSDLERIFDPFYSTKFQGRGLGLASVYGIARDAGGWVSVQSRPGQGSTFTVYLPSAGSSGGCDPVVAPPDPRPQALVADDDVVVRPLLVELLAELGFGAHVARDGRELLQLYRAQPDAVDVVLLDVNMPVMDGLETLAHVRAMDPKLPVVLHTGATDPRLAEVLRADPHCTQLRKPFALDQLEAALERVTGAALRRLKR